MSAQLEIIEEQIDSKIQKSHRDKCVINKTRIEESKYAIINNIKIAITIGVDNNCDTISYYENKFTVSIKNKRVVDVANVLHNILSLAPLSPVLLLLNIIQSYNTSEIDRDKYSSKIASFPDTANKTEDRDGFVTAVSGYSNEYQLTQIEDKLLMMVKIVSPTDLYQ